MRYSVDHKEQTRNKLLSVAAQAIREHGPERISVASVMSRAGLTHGGFYAHFPSKEALVVASIEHMFEQMSAHAEEVIRGKTPQDALNDYIDSYLSKSHCNERGSGCPIASLGSDLPRLDDSARKAFTKGMATEQRRTSSLFQALGIADPRAAAQSLRSEMLGALLSARLVSSSERSAVLETSKRAIKHRFGLVQ